MKGTQREEGRESVGGKGGEFRSRNGGFLGEGESPLGVEVRSQWSRKSHSQYWCRSQTSPHSRFQGADEISSRPQQTCGERERTRGKDAVLHRLLSGGKNREFVLIYL